MTNDARKVDDLDTLVEWYPAGEDEAELIEFYLDGNCWHLALALHRATGWPICVMGPHTQRTVGTPEFEFVHAGCLHPNGMVVDVTGIADGKTMQARWGSEPLTLTEPEFMAACDIEFSPAAMANAEHVAIKYLFSRQPDLDVNATASPRTPYDSAGPSTV